MGSMISHWWWGGDPDVKNEISGMTLRDIYNVQKSWALIYAKPYEHGFLMFVRLFQAEPESKKFFRGFSILSEAELNRSVQFKAHVLRLMTSFDSSIEHLKTPELVIAWMTKLGESHARFKIPSRHFWILKDVLVNILRNDLRLSEDVVESWGRYVTFIYEHILDKLPE